MSSYTHLQEHKMFKKLFKWLSSPSSELELYILSKHPTNAAEVEYWTVQYNHNSQKGAWL